MINIVERKFSVLGVIFWPQDNLIFAPWAAAVPDRHRGVHRRFRPALVRVEPARKP